MRTTVLGIGIVFAAADCGASVYSNGVVLCPPIVPIGRASVKAVPRRRIDIARETCILVRGRAVAVRYHRFCVRLIEC